MLADPVHSPIYGSGYAPDFAHFIIDYVPKAWPIESKSLKLYLVSFRDHSGLREECTIAIGKPIAAGLKPAYLRIGGYWYRAYRLRWPRRPRGLRQVFGRPTRA
jgi:hypothetical protein